MLAYVYISRLSNDIKIAILLYIQKNHLWGSNFVQNVGPFQKRRHCALKPYLHKKCAFKELHPIFVIPYNPVFKIMFYNLFICIIIIYF